MRLVAATLAAAVCLSAAGQAAAQEGFVWQYQRYVDADPFQSRFVLFYGIPETDAVQVVATCRIGAGGTYATIELGADVRSVPEGQAIEVQFIGRGFDRVILGDAVGQDREEGLSGVSLPVELDDPLWGAIRSLSELHYNLTGQPAQRLSLKGSSGPAQDFLRDCRDMPGPNDIASPGEPPAPPMADAPPPPPAAAAMVSCNALGALRTVDTGQPASVTFINRTDGFRSVMWIDGDGTPQPYKDLDPGNAYTQETNVGHPWMITDGPGNCLEIYMPPPGGSVFEITAPNRDFGPE